MTNSTSIEIKKNIIARANRPLSRFIILVVFVCSVWFLGYYFRIDQKILKDFLDRYPIGLQWVIFIFLYTLVTFFFWAIKDPLKIIGAVVFGAYISTFLIWISEIIDCTMFFYSSRYLVRGIFTNTLRGVGKNIDDKIAKANFLWLFLLRFVPLIPFRVLDVSAGLTKINFKKYLLVVIIASPIRIFWIQYILAAIGESIFQDPAVLVQYLYKNNLMAWISFLYFIAVIIVAVKLRRRA